MMRLAIYLYVTVFIQTAVFAENGYQLWQRYAPLESKTAKDQYMGLMGNMILEVNSPTRAVIRDELKRALRGTLGLDPNFSDASFTGNGVRIDLISKPGIREFFSSKTADSLGKEGFVIRRQTGSGQPDRLIISANSDIGLLYGTFHLIRLMASGTDLSGFHFLSAPKIALRMLNHWDNLTRTVERGYAGQSIWNWHTLPDLIDQRYIDYARANASIGMNATALTNVNANATVLTPMYLQKVKALADVFRPYGIRVFLTARFSAPIEIGKLSTADPNDPEVAKWWAEKAKEIYELIPDFGGFLVKA
ncbi:MAG TPA: alpha-glucuronidase family glycosyl hydrolase, partial [Phnomibacter sp.]|nr:alpha-glucuronidase family glycosyl hydrolase [Phnomibacter sp.]